jgi:ATP/maltotriose-dependent transcriptional regulator MalT
MAQASVQLFETLGDSHYLPDPQLLLARIALVEGDYAAAEDFAAVALAQFESRGDAVPAASARLVQAELAQVRGYSAEAAALRQQAAAGRRASARPLTPREQARYEALANSPG